MDNFTALSRLRDEKIDAYSILGEMTIGHYLTLAMPIIENNAYQRNRVKDSKSVYSLLRQDLKKGCTFPPIVLAYNSSNINMNDTIEQMVDTFRENHLIILDGLQRTLSMKDVQEELTDDEEALRAYNARFIRIEIYVGIDKLGILYRMLTLNTGQTRMPIRHQIEILYSDLDDGQLDNIIFHKQVDGATTVSSTDFQFKDAIECFYSYIQQDPNGMGREQVLETIEGMGKLSDNNKKRNLFESLIKSYSHFLQKIDDLTNHWSTTDPFFRSIGSNVFKFFNKSTVMSGYGAAIGELEDLQLLDSIDDVNSLIDRMTLGHNNAEQFMKSVAMMLNEIKGDASKIGREQRRYFHTLFKYLFINIKDGETGIYPAIDKAYRRFKAL